MSGRIAEPEALGSALSLKRPESWGEMCRTTNCRTVMYTLPQTYICKVWKLSLVVVVQKLCVGWESTIQVFLIFQQEGGKCCQITNTCSLCKMLSTRLLCTPCFSLSSAVHCSPLLNDWRGQWGSQKNLKPRWPPASSFNQRPRGLLTHKHATSQCWLLQATWNPLPLDQGLLLRCISWAWLPDVLGTNLTVCYWKSNQKWSQPDPSSPKLCRFIQCYPTPHTWRRYFCYWTQV